MKRFPITDEYWQQVEGPRRYETRVMDGHALHNAASVTVWEATYDGLAMKPAEVDILLTPNGVEITSSYKFIGEVRMAY